MDLGYSKLTARSRQQTVFQMPAPAVTFKRKEIKLEKEEISFVESVRRYDEIATMENKTNYFGEKLDRFKRGKWNSSKYLFVISIISVIGILSILSYYFYHQTNFVSI